MTCRGYAALALWVLGYPDQALAQSHDALTIAEERSHPFTVAMALAYAAMIRQLRREVHTTLERAKATTTFCMEQGFPFFLALGTMLRGWALAHQGGSGEDIEQIRRQQAKSLELRAAMSLAQLWRDQGKRAEARDLLAPVYGWFTEGFCTPVLQEAKALLDKLA